MKYGKRLKQAYETVDKSKVYDIDEAVKLIKENAKGRKPKKPKKPVPILWAMKI